MANPRLAMDAAFWDLGISTARTLDGRAKSVPGEPVPLDGARASQLLRPSQLALLRNGFPLGIIPSFSPPARKELGFFSPHAFIPGPYTRNWYTGLIFQFRPKKLISDIKAEVIAADELDLNALRDAAQHVLNKSLYDLGFFSEFGSASNTSFSFNVERHGDSNEHRTKATIVHDLQEHEIKIEAASPELFLDQKGTYWNSPLSLSFDVASKGSLWGLRYHFGLHNNTGHPQALNSSSGDPPLALLPGLCAKAAFSYEKSTDFWREKVEEVSPRENDTERALSSSYDDHLKEPHSALSGIIGGSYAAWFGGNKNLGGPAGLSGETQIADASEIMRSPSSAEWFGSLCYSFQRGKFKNDFNDLTRLDARLDIPYAASFLRGARHLFSDALRKPVKQEVNPLSSPRLSLILQQQVAGPIVFRVDSRFSFNSPSGGHGPHLDDVLLGLSYSLRLLRSGKVLAWYSPKRKESMVELRLFEF